MSIPTEDWFVFKPEALAYLNLVAGEIRLKTAKDPMLARLADRLRVHYVHHSGIEIGKPGFDGRSEFHFEADRGRVFKGHRYSVHRAGHGALILWKMGSSGIAELPSDTQNLTGQILLDAILEIIVRDVYAE